MTRAQRMRTLTSIAGAVLLLASAAGAAEVRVAASNALEEAQLELAAAFEKATGHKVSTIWGGTEAITKRVAAGDAIDVVVIAGQNVDTLIGAGKIVAGSRADLAKSGIGIAVRSGLPRPDVSTPEKLRQAVLGAKSVVYSIGPSGIYLGDLFRRMGIHEQIKKKVVQAPSGVQVGHLLAAGVADLGFQQISELQNVIGIDYLGPLPQAIQHYTVFTAARHVSAISVEAADAYITFVTGPVAQPILRRIGMEPVNAPR